MRFGERKKFLLPYPADEVKVQCYAFSSLRGGETISRNWKHYGKNERVTQLEKKSCPFAWNYEGEKKCQMNCIARCKDTRVAYRARRRGRRGADEGRLIEFHYFSQTKNIAFASRAHDVGNQYNVPSRVRVSGARAWHTNHISKYKLSECSLLTDKKKNKKKRVLPAR